MKIIAILFVVAAALFYVASVCLFFAGKEEAFQTSMINALGLIVAYLSIRVASLAHERATSGN